MYIKIMQQSQDEYSEQMFECTNYQYKENNKETEFSIIHDEDNITTVTFENHPTTKIWVMNDNGVTIDSYRYNEKGKLR